MRKTDFEQRIKAAKKVFFEHSGGSREQKKAYFSTLANQKRATISLLIFKVAHQNPLMFNSWTNLTNVDFQQIYDEGLAEMSQEVFPQFGLVSEDYPKRQNFLSLNNFMTRIRKDGYSDGSEPLVTPGRKISFHPLVFSRPYVELQEFFWLLKTEGYFRDFKNNAHIMEQRSVVTESKKRHCVPDGGIDGYINFGDLRIPFDHKEMIVSLENVASLLAHGISASSNFAIKSKGSTGVFSSTGMFSDKFKGLCTLHSVRCTVIIDGDYQILIFQTKE